MHPALYWEKTDGSTVKCRLCPHNCEIEIDEKGICGGRENSGGSLFATHYGLVSSLALDPIEKKPLRRFHPGSQILSVGGFGCNFCCPYCQNSSISLEYERSDGEVLTPEQILALAKQSVSHGNIGVAYTYNEPVVGYEFINDCAKLIAKAGLQNVLVTNGFINKEPLEQILPLISAMNIDLKAFSPEFYQNVGGDLAMVKRTIEAVHQHCHLEVTTLVIPGENEEDITELAKWIAIIDPDIPLHIGRFVPRYRYAGHQPATTALTTRLGKVASEWLNYVYT
ncbi:MAG: AmmeMemoRadiSam system radical SAM enzyme [Lachnospiraceae bacterium]|jgi:pyruvate formate lyase activating enzyme|nr:AmmeMemoRadiSam system radical SAM enzyme [Lachnospiraceae bacterium]